MRVLGAVRLVDADGTVRAPRSVTQRRLLALLALRSGSTTRVEAIAEVLAISPAAVRTSMSRLRATVGDEILCTDPLGYRLVADTDAARFARAVHDVAGRTGHDALTLLEDALDLWEGPAVDEFAHEPWAVADVARLDELYAVAVEHRVEALIELGRHGEAIAELDLHIGAHPLRDRPRALMMVALARDGRLPEALRSYQRYRSVLGDAVGTEPSAELRELERRLASANASVDESGLAGRRPARYRSSFVGREIELRAVDDRLVPGALVTLTGEGGVGKTRLARQVAERAPLDRGAVHIVELAPVGSSDVPAVVAAACGAQHWPALVAELSSHPGLVVLDNCEHVIDAAAGAVAELLDRCPQLTILATSREALSIDGELVVRVAPLDPAGAGAELLRERVCDGGGSLERDEHTDLTIHELCRRLDGNPLAIELAAARVVNLGLGTVVEGLRDRANLLGLGRRDTVERHRTLRDTIDWSYRLLDDDERWLFRVLGVFVDGCEADAVEHVVTRLGGRGVRVVSRLGALASRHLVEVDTSGVSTRFRLLETVRAFALDELRRAGEWEAVADAHADWVAALTDVPHIRWMSRGAHARCVRLERDVENWRAALLHVGRRSDPALAARLCGAPSALLVWGRPSALVSLLALEGDLEPGDPALLGPRLARWGPAFATFDDDAMRESEELVRAGDPNDTTGAVAVMSSARLILAGDVLAAIDVRERYIARPDAIVEVADYCAALTLYVLCSHGRRDRIEPGCIDRALAIAERSDVPTVRLVSWIALAWALAPTDTPGSTTFTNAALDAHEPLPVFHRRLTANFLGRFLIGQAPAVAADVLTRYLDGARSGTSVHGDDATEVLGVGADLADGVALATAIALLGRCGHPLADDGVATLAHGPSRSYLAALVPDFRERSARGSILEHGDLVARVHAALLVLGRALVAHP